MIERIADMPPGTIGLRSTGKLTKADYVEVLEPALAEGVDSGELRFLFAIEDFDGLEAGAFAEDFKTGMRSWIRDHSAWRRFALVTDVEWIARAMHMFGWMAPGETMVVGVDGLDDAKAWVADR